MDNMSLKEIGNGLSYGVLHSISEKTKIPYSTLLSLSREEPGDYSPKIIKRVTSYLMKGK